MYNQSQTAREYGADSVESMPKRTLRKGTRSCAECKRRKTRCFFDRPTATACIGCQRRGTYCMSQEFVDVPMSEPRDDQVLDRLKRVEHMLESIVNKVPAEDSTVMMGRESDAIEGDAGYVAAVPLRLASTEATTGLGLSSRVVEFTEQLSTVSVPSAEASAALRYLPKYTDTCRALHAALPSQKDAETLFAAGRAAIFVQALCNYYSELFDERNVLVPSTLATLPPVTSHPVILARKLLQLALCIQQLDPSFDTSVINLELGLSFAMKTYFDLASDMVVCHDELLDSLEGLECLVYQGVYLVNSGSLRRALVSLRRAATIAQFMGMHRKSNRKEPKRHDPTTRVSSEVTWVHIAYLERYLSVLLNMPSAITQRRFATEEKTAGETPTEWMEKIQIDIFDRIVERNQNGNFQDVATTEKIDHELNRIASSLPPKWWAPFYLNPAMDEIDIMESVIIAQMQIIHYGLLTILHLPYLLRRAPDHRFDYSKNTCTYASREVLSRYLAFRSVVQIVYCCRPVDFCALTAALSLLLAHLHSRRQNSGWQLTHQRVSDRLLIERVVEKLDELNRLNNDELSSEIAKLARKLLNIEAECAKMGGRYSGDIVDDGQSGSHENERDLLIKIPYFGTVKIVCEPSYPASSSVPVSMASSQADIQQLSLTSMFTPNSTSLSSEPRTSSGGSVAPPPDTVGYRTIELVQNHSNTLVEDRQVDFPISQQLVVLQDPGQSHFDLAMPDLIADVEDWAFQGVDAAFFESLISGSIDEQTGWDATWSGGIS
ncbi:hypothetical protein GQ53DRAFT_838337 [Thozetella sp. PMI_491]|nr:hypothetical protein GQ53DRAFT_838337 [Thozetella sp. PMI_491]